MKKIVIDRKKCVGCGLCATIAPKTFKLDKDGKSVVINQEASSEGEIKRALESCPVKAIIYKNTD